MYRYRLFIALLVGMIVGPAYGQETAGRKGSGDEAAANFGSGLALEGEEAFIGEPLTGQGSDKRVDGPKRPVRSPTRAEGD